MKAGQRKAAKLAIDVDLIGALEEITGPGISWQDLALAYIRGSVAEFWSNAAEGSGLEMSRYRERVRAFMREGDALIVACRKARER